MSKTHLSPIGSRATASAPRSRFATERAFREAVEQDWPMATIVRVIKTSFYWIALLVHKEKQQE